MYKTLLISAACVFFGIMFWMNEDYKEAMVICQVEHSFETCFYSLNR